MRPNSVRLPLIAAVALLTTLVAAPARAALAPAQVGEFETISIAVPSPYPAGAGADARSWNVRYPGATYIRVHFSRFDLAAGDALELTSADGSESYRYTGRGPHGTGEFWANAVLGDSAILRLQASVGGGLGFEIDAFGRGIVDIGGEIPPAPEQPESVCGTTDWKDPKCYETGYPTEFGRARGVALALIGCCSSCTAFKVSDNGQFMTNNHCTATTTGVQSTELRFDYQLSGCASGTSSFTGSVMGSSLLRTDAALDYTLFTTTGASGAIPCLQLDNRLAPVGERIYIPGHPAGGVKKLSIESTTNAGGLCRVDASPYAGNTSTSDVGYYCDTTNGSSGSPVLSGDTHKVVALHHFGGCLNSGARMDLIVPQISGLLGSCAGGGGTCGNSACDVGETSCSCPGDCGPAPASETSCTDGIDNDCGGGTDCADTDCASAPSCAPTCKPSGQVCLVNADCCSSNCRAKGKSGKKTCQ